MDDYDRIRELGRGSFGAAILVRRKTDQKQLVVKEVNLGSLSQKEIAEARKEANFLANLSHPNIVRYEGCLEKEKKLMIFMEFCEGGDLSEKIKKQNGVLFTEEIILDWFCQECFEAHIFGAHKNKDQGSLDGLELGVRPPVSEVLIRIFRKTF